MSSLYFREEGSGPPIVLLHGFCETHEIWSDFIAPLAKKFRVIIPDLPGFGSSPALSDSFTIDDVGHAVAHWLTDMGINRSLVIGHSLGGYVTLSLAAHHPQLLQGFGLFHASAYADSQERKDSRNKIISFVTSHGVAPFIDTFVPSLFFDKSSLDIQTVHKIAAGTKKDTLIGYTAAMRDRPDRTFILSKSQLSKLIIAGAGDMLVPIEASREMGKMSQKSSFYELPKVAHMGFFEAKTDCQLIITRFAEALFFNN